MPISISRYTATESQLTVMESAYAAQQDYAALEDAYRRPLEGPETRMLPAGKLPQT